MDEPGQYFMSFYCPLLHFMSDFSVSAWKPGQALANLGNRPVLVEFWPSKYLLFSQSLFLSWYSAFYIRRQWHFYKG